MLAGLSITILIFLVILALCEFHDLRKPGRRYVRYSLYTMLSLTAAVCASLTVRPRDFGLLCFPFFWCAFHFGPEFLLIILADLRGSHYDCRRYLLRSRGKVKRRKWWKRTWKSGYVSGRQGQDHQIGIDYREPRS